MSQLQFNQQGALRQLQETKEKSKSVCSPMDMDRPMRILPQRGPISLASHARHAADLSVAIDL